MLDKNFVERCGLGLFASLTFAAVCTPVFAQTIRVEMTASQSTNSFVPTEALGAGIDRMQSATVEKVFTPPIIDKVLTAGWQTVSYRQNTELFAEAWHWNPEGTWSDPKGQGYFTGNATLGEPIRHSYGYLLPHRGVTRNDGTGTNGYSRITDGDLATASVLVKRSARVRHKLREQSIKGLRDDSRAVSRVSPPPCLARARRYRRGREVRRHASRRRVVYSPEG